jgi:hypothetical protein
MEWRISEISKGIDVDSGVVDESADDGDTWTHGSIVKRSPAGLIFVVDVDCGYWIFFLKHLDELHRLVLNDCR